MKRMLILVIIAMLAGPLFAEEATLIDFSVLTADIHVKLGDNDTDDKPNQNRQTVMDFSHVAGGSFTTQQKQVMKTSLAIENWEILLASSARHVTNIALSYTREAPSKKYGTVMGVRVHFPTEPHNSGRTLSRRWKFLRLNRMRISMMTELLTLLIPTVLPAPAALKTAMAL